ncbi:hypothetical protein ACWEKM_31375 [Streptomyces sp. NPDC004752]
MKEPKQTAKRGRTPARVGSRMVERHEVRMEQAPALTAELHDVPAEAGSPQAMVD